MIDVLRRLLKRPVAMICMAYLLALVVVAIVAPVAMPWVNGEQAGDLLAASQGPSVHHLLGTDSLGRDVLERLLVGTRVTLAGVGEGVGVAVLLGLPLGLAAGYRGGWVDRVVTWLADVTFSVPAIVIVIVVLTIFPESMLAGMVAFGILVAPGLMRVMRSATLVVSGEPYIEAARVSGLSGPRIVWSHVLPRTSGVFIVQTSLLAAAALATQAGLAFLNLLVAVPAPSWGGMVDDGTKVLLTDSWLIWPPGIAIALTMLALSLLGDAVRDTVTQTWVGEAASAPARRRRSGWRARVRGRHGYTAQVEAPSSAPLLTLDDVAVSFASHGGRSLVLDGVGFRVESGQTVGLVGESGSGKTVTGSSILGLLPGTGRIERGRIAFAGVELTSLGEHELNRLRGRELALISQEPIASFDPTYRVGAQIAEYVRQHHGLSRARARRRTLELLAQVHLPDPGGVADRFPHELSGGMAQRVAIARALAGEPRLLIADEPTTALDVTVQSEILRLLSELQRTQDLGILLITHDWGVVADICDRVVVMYAGEVVEQGMTDSIFTTPLHPYTQALLAANPHATKPDDVLPTLPGQVPAPGSWPEGCHFQPRCAVAVDACRQALIPLTPVTDGDRASRCVLVSEPVSG